MSDDLKDSILSLFQASLEPCAKPWKPSLLGRRCLTRIIWTYGGQQLVTG